MILLWILGILALLLLLLCLTRVGIRATMRSSRLTLDLSVGPARLRLYPRPERRPESRNNKKKKKKPEESEPGQRLPVPTLEDVRDALRSLPAPIVRAFLRIGRGVRIHPLTVSLVFGGWEDPPAAAEAYGTANAALWTGMPLLERWLDIPAPDIHLDVDFAAPETVTEGEVGVSARIGTLLSAGLGAAVPMVLWILRVFRRRRESGKKEAASEI